MKRLLLLPLLLLSTGVAAGDFPVFAARCTSELSVDTNPEGVVYMNGKPGKVIHRPDGQISANSAGNWVDITPQGAMEPRVTYTDRNKNVGTCEILSFAPPKQGGSAGGGMQDSAARAGQGDFDAHAPIRCSERGGRWTECQAAVARDGGGTATVVVTRPDGRKRFIFFEQGRAVGADLSQADGNQRFHATREDDMYFIEAGDERYEFIEALVFGG